MANLLTRVGQVTRAAGQDGRDRAPVGRAVGPESAGLTVTATNTSPAIGLVPGLSCRPRGPRLPHARELTWDPMIEARVSFLVALCIPFFSPTAE